MATFHDRFNLLFSEYDKSQEEFGAKFGATKGQVFNWRSHRGEPDSEMLKAIANACHVSVDWLVGNSDNRISAAEVMPQIEKVKFNFAHDLIGEFEQFIKQKYQ